MDDYIVPNAADSDTLKGYYLMVCAPATKPEKGANGEEEKK